ncbi:phytochelatin synthase family protein [Paraburkholderia sp. LEh10]|nr:phytochelatin synthase family protein [Paraburkholderia sp. LEh10]
MSVRIVLLRSAAIMVLLFAAATRAETLPLPPNLISLSSDSGEEILLESTARRSYWPLSIQFVTQKNQAYCGVATMVMVLNALSVTAPPTPGIEPFKTFTQENVLNPSTERILPQDVLREKGMTLDQFAGLVGTYGVKAEVYHADTIDIDGFRTLASQALDSRGSYVVVNYLRRTLGEESGGHISPLAAFDAKTDRFLVLDVARYKYPPVWVKTADLYSAMNTTDSDNQGRRRGFVLVRTAP